MSSDEIESKRLKMDDTSEIHCHHWVHRKKRFCKMTVLTGRNYCGEHKPIAQIDDENDERIPCPLDSKHTVYKKKLQKHLRICNAQPQSTYPDYVVKNINAGDEMDKELLQTYTNIKLSELTDEEFYNTVEKVKNIYKKFVEGQIEELHAHHTLLDSELAREDYGKESKKHLKQTAALLGVLEDNEQIKSKTTFIEFGAGKGQLAFYLAQLLKKHENSRVVLLDRMSLRHKKDNKVEDRSLVERLRVDIADFYMPGLNVFEGTERFVAFSKHLCGGATDLTLRCITQTNEQVEDPVKNPPTTEFIMIALCCHHRCDWATFVGKEFMLEQGIDARQFTIITKMVSWAICGTGMSREIRRELELQKSSDDLKEAIVKQRLTLEERESIGFKCKRILDFARLEYLKKHDYEAVLKYYVQKDVTLENTCLIATKNKV